MSTTSEHGLLEKLMTRELPLEQEQEMVKQCVKDRPALLPSLMATLVSQKHHYRVKCEEAETRYRKLADMVQEPPWHPAAFLGLTGGGERAVVALGARRLCVGFAPGFDRAGLRRVRNVFLNAQTNLIVGDAPGIPRAGVIAEFSRAQGGGQAVLRGPSGEEITVDLADDLAGELKEQDLVIYDRESHVAWGKAAGRHRQSGLLEELPLDVCIEQLGGLDQIFWELATEVSLHLFHPELAAQYRLGASLGCLFCGPPGTGKTSLVRALAGYLRRTRGVDLKAFSAPPGSHRSMWFGESERRIRDLFSEIKDLSQEGAYSLLLWDDLDHLGSRDHGVSGEIDARLLPCLLQEIDGLKGARVMLLGCTNREDLLDEALLRRFGRIFRVGRPNREQAREIFRRYLTPELPYCDHGAAGAEVARRLADEAVAAAYAPNGEFAALATLTLRDGTRKPLLASEVMTGALIALIAEGAKRRGCFRELAGGPAGITSGDVSAALARELDSLAARLKPGPALRTLLNLPGDLDVVRIEPRRAAGTPPRSEFLESA